MPASAPSIRPLTEPLAGVPAFPRDGVELFVVVREGTFGGRAFGSGEVLVCRGEARGTDPTVLVARGHGRPRLGRVQGARLIGDAGETCLPERWRAAGRLVACYRHAAHGWVVELFDGELNRELRRELGDLPAGVEVGEAKVKGARRASPTSNPMQLSLFAA